MNISSEESKVIKLEDVRKKKKLHKPQQSIRILYKQVNNTKVGKAKPVLKSEKVMSYVQLFLFLGFTAYILRQCGS